MEEKETKSMKEDIEDLKKSLDQKEIESEKAVDKKTEIKKIYDVENDVCKIGEIVLTSSKFNTEELVNLALQVIERDPVRDYLHEIKNKKFKGTYVG